MIQLHLIRTIWYGLYYVLRSSQKSIFLKSGQIAIGQNKVFCGANDSIITLQSAGDATITPIKLLEINEPSINRSTNNNNEVQIDFNTSWDNLPTNIPSENLRLYRIIYVVSGYEFNFTSLSYGLGRIYINFYNFFDSSTNRIDTDFGSNTSGTMNAELACGCNILANVDIGTDHTTYNYKYDTKQNYTAGSLSTVMSQPQILIAGSSSSVRYTVSGHFKYAVYGIV